MSALPMHPTERDRERFRDLTKAIVAGLEYNRCPDGEYREATTQIAWRIWWSVERERQLLQNLNQSQGCKLSELLARAEKAEAELARLREQEPAGYVFGDWRGATTISAVKDSHFNTPLYAEPIPAPAVPVEWRKVMAELADDLAIEIDQDYPPERKVYPSEQRRYEGEMEIVNRARALLQSAEVRHD